MRVNFGVFSFSREKYFFSQICLECAETSRNEKKKTETNVLGHVRSLQYAYGKLPVRPSS